MHTGLELSSWVQRWTPLIAPRGSVLDVACGSGRHLRWLQAQGFAVTGIDRDAAAVAPLHELGRVIVADIEKAPWPLADETFDAVIVTNYLWRPLLATIVAAVAPGGVLIYETFAVGNQTLGKPSNPQFLLRPGELLSAASGLRVVAYEDGFVTEPDRFVQRLVAVREAQAAPVPPRYRL